MAKTRDLDDAVRDPIKAGLIGQPVFIRCLIGLTDNPDEQLKTLVDTIMTVRGWFDVPIEQVYALGPMRRSCSVFLRFSNGASALVCGQSTGRWITDLIIVGNHGAMYRDSFWGGFSELNRSFPETDEKRSIRKALELAAASGEPQTIPARSA